MLSLKLLAFALAVGTLDAACTFPSYLHGTWTHQTLGTDVYTANTLTSTTGGTSYVFSCDTLVSNNIIIYRSTNVSANIDAVMCINLTQPSSDNLCHQRLNMETIATTYVQLVGIGMPVFQASTCNVTGAPVSCYTKYSPTTVATMVTQGSGAHISSEVSLAVLLPCLFMGLLKKMM